MLGFAVLGGEAAKSFVCRKRPACTARYERIRIKKAPVRRFLFKEIVRSSRFRQKAKISEGITGGRERRWRKRCGEYGCRAKGMHDETGSFDILIFFAGTMPHKRMRCAIDETKNRETDGICVFSCRLQRRVVFPMGIPEAAEKNHFLGSPAFP